MQLTLRPFAWSRKTPLKKGLVVLIVPKLLFSLVGSLINITYRWREIATSTTILTQYAANGALSLY